MDKSALTAQLAEQYQAFLAHLDRLDETTWVLQPNGKWSAGQQLDHIVRAVKPVNLAFGLPKWVPRLLFGRANRPSRTYEGLVEKYKSKLSAGAKASKMFVPPPAQWEDKTAQMATLEKTVAKLCKRLQRYSEAELDNLLLPHPILGKLTLREMLYFTIYHVQHHKVALPPIG